LRLSIIGGGVSGLMASYVFKKKGIESIVYESKKVGGEFLNGNVKYIKKTRNMTSLLDDLGMLYSDYNINGGVLLGEKVLNYSYSMKRVDIEKKNIIQFDQYKKIRRIESDNYGSKSINDSAISCSRKALYFDFNDFICRLENSATIKKRELTSVDSKNKVLKFSNGEKVNYDILIMTIPLWETRKLVDFYVPDGIAMKLNIIDIIPNKNKYMRWDYVYTPYTPFDTIYRFTQNYYGYSVEVNGDLSCQKRNVHGDLAYIFPDGFSITETKEDLKGYLLNFLAKETTEWPENIFPLGRFSQWNQKLVTNSVLDEIYKINIGEKNVN
jgi:hypothetical protein